MKPTKCYALSTGEYEQYMIHAIYKRREDAEAAAQKIRPESRTVDVEEFDFYEGKPLPAPVEEKK